MAEYTRRTRTTVHVEYAVPNPTNWAEISKALNAISTELSAHATGDDTVLVRADDEQIVFYWVESVDGSPAQGGGRP